MVRKTVIHATLPEQIAIKALIEEHSTVVEEAGPDGKSLRQLHDGWTCDRIANAVSPKLNASHVSGVARAFSWKFANAAPRQNGELAATVEALSRRMDDMETSILKFLESQEAIAKGAVSAAQSLDQVEADVRLLKQGQNNLEKGHRALHKEVQDLQKGKSTKNSISARG